MGSKNILVNYEGEIHEFFKIKELKNRHFLYSFAPSDGKTKILIGEEYREVGENEEKTTIEYKDMSFLKKEIDHISLHTDGCHIISSSRSPKNNSYHYGKLEIPEIKNENILYQIGILMPSKISKLPILNRKIDPNKDIIINIEGRIGFSINLYYFNQLIKPGEKFELLGDESTANILLNSFIMAFYKSSLLVNINWYKEVYNPDYNILVRWVKKENIKLCHISYYN